MLSLLIDPEAWISLATLTVLEIVLGIDNIIFLSIVSSRLPRHQQALGRRIGLCLALLGRLFLLFSIAWMTRLTAPLLVIAGFVLSWRDIVLAAFGLTFLSTLYPAWRAARVQPADVLRYE